MCTFKERGAIARTMGADSTAAGLTRGAGRGVRPPAPRLGRRGAAQARRIAHPRRGSHRPRRRGVQERGARGRRRGRPLRRRRAREGCRARELPRGGGARRRRGNPRRGGPHRRRGHRRDAPRDEPLRRDLHPSRTERPVGDRRRGGHGMRRGARRRMPARRRRTDQRRVPRGWRSLLPRRVQSHLR